MFGPALRRAVPTACTASTTSCSSHFISALSVINAAGAQAIARPTHQRRYSSSGPPDSSRGSSAPQPPPSSTSPRSNGKKVEKKSCARGSRKKAAAAATAAANMINPPQVPMTKHLQETDVNLSSFFSLHRPISVTASIPTPATQSSFDSIFNPRVQENNKFADVIYSLSSTVENLEAAYEGYEDGAQVRDDGAHGPSSHGAIVAHLDGIPKLSLDRVIRQYRPFNPPPAPVPFNESGPKRKQSSKQRSRAAAGTSKVGQAKRSWKTTIVVTETTDADGSPLFTAATTPMVEIPVNPQRTVEETPASGRSKAYLPFYNRMRIRRSGWVQRIKHQQGGKMMLISVKRQRKLKMKKHKYKKLMKRTRNLRRKLDRA